jgi:hypothetical protein
MTRRQYFEFFTTMAGGFHWRYPLAVLPRNGLPGGVKKVGAIHSRFRDMVLGRSAVMG